VGHFISFAETKVSNLHLRPKVLSDTSVIRKTRTNAKLCWSETKESQNHFKFSSVVSGVFTGSAAVGSTVLSAIQQCRPGRQGRRRCSTCGCRAQPGRPPPCWLAAVPRPPDPPAPSLATNSKQIINTFSTRPCSFVSVLYVCCRRDTARISF